MNKTIKIALIILGVVTAMGAVAQPDFKGQVKEKMTRFSFMIGEWEGTGQALSYDGQWGTSEVKEVIAYELDSTVIRLRGLGLSDGKNVHDALGYLYYDVSKQQYRMKSWLAKGMNTDANVEFITDTKLKWWFQAGPTTMRYTITYDGKMWNEVGEMSMDGKTWQKVFEMNLTKI